MKPITTQVLVGSFSALGSFLFGYDLSCIAMVVASDSFMNLFLQENPSVKSGTVVSLYTAGAFFGALFSGLTEKLGRRGAICLASSIFVVGGSIQTAGVNIGMLYAGRFIAGYGVGILVMTIPVFLSEIAHHKIRGFISSLHQLVCTIGQVVAAWVSYGCYMAWNSSGSSKTWRVTLAIQIIPALFLSSLIFFFPESPRWLMNHERYEEALVSLATLHADGNTQDDYVVAEFDLIKEQIIEEHSLPPRSYWSLFKERKNFRRMVLIFFVQAGCQMTGVSALQYFSPDIFLEIGISTGMTLLFTAVSTMMGLIGTLGEMYLIDTIGRRPLGIGGNAIQGVMFLIGAVLLAKYKSDTTATSAHWGFIITTWLWNLCYLGSMAPLSWLIPPELLPVDLRIKGVSIGVMTSFAFNTMIGQITPTAIKNIGWKYYILFIIGNFGNALFFWAFYPETKGISLEEMEDLFESSPIFVPTSKYEYKHTLDKHYEQIRQKQTITDMEVC